MSLNHKESAQLTKLQNQFRGLVASLRNSRFTSEMVTPIAQRYWSGLKDIFLAARVSLPVNLHEEFISWVDKQEATVLLDISNTPKSYEQLSGVGTSKPADILTELRWMSVTLRRKAQELSIFRAKVEAIERHVVSDDISSCLEIVSQIEQLFGISLWGVQLKIALTQEAEGLEAQKKLVANIQGVFERGLLGFVAYYCGIRNESRTTADSFTRNTDQRIEEHPYFSKEVRSYLRRTLLGRAPTTPNGIADTLRVSQSHHFIDQYEEFIAAIQNIASSPELDEYRPAVLSYLEKLEAIDDYRLKKLKCSLSGEPISQSGKPRNHKVFKSTLDGNTRHALRCFVKNRALNENPDIWEYIYAGWVVADSKFKVSKERRIHRRCIRYIAAMFTSTDLFDPHDALTKLSRNFSQLPVFASLKLYTDLINNRTLLESLNHNALGLNSKYYGPEDASNPSDLSTLLQGDPDRYAGNSVSEFWQHYFGTLQVNQKQGSAFHISSAVGASVRGNRDEIANSLSFLEGKSLSGVTQGFFDLVALQNSVDTFDKAGIVERIAVTCSRSRYSPLWHRVGTVTDGLTWTEFCLCQDPILRAVAIHMMWTQSQTSKSASMLRFAVSNYLKNSDIDKPSELEIAEIETAAEAVVYFLQFVCTADVLDVSRAVRGSRAVLEERAAICHLLSRIDQNNSQFHMLEAEEIQQQLTFADGQMIVDSSRIYVETPQLRQWARKNIAEEYSRYRDLARVDIENFRAFDELMAEISKNPTQGMTQFVPESEADVLLFKILARIKDEFLTNASFGLDFFLSKRIRHQSFIGSIRGPLEFADLITNRPDLQSNYKPNYTWTNKLAVASATAQSDLLTAFEVFAEKFDTALLDAKDRYFQVRSKETPDGLIFLDLNTYIVELVKTMVPLDSSFDEFLDTVEALLWVGLEPALRITRSFITDELKRKLTSAIDELRTAVRDSVGNSSEFLTFDAEVGKRSNEVQVKLDESAGWFTRTNMDFAEKAFELGDAIQMAQKFALSCLPGFEPVLEVADIQSDTKIEASSLVLLHDLILIALQNAKDHSGEKNPRIATNAVVDSEKGTLRIRVESDVKTSLRPNAQKGAEEKTKLIAEGKSAFRSRKEGGSGFFKLAAVTSQSKKSDLSFGLAESGRFFLEVQYSLIVAKQSR